jgi:hypothetical protein
MYRICGRDRWTLWVLLTAELRDTASYRPSREDIDAALIELQMHLATSVGRERRWRGHSPPRHRRPDRPDPHP